MLRRSITAGGSLQATVVSAATLRRGIMEKHSRRFGLAADRQSIPQVGNRRYISAQEARPFLAAARMCFGSPGAVMRS